MKPTSQSRFSTAIRVGAFLAILLTFGEGSGAERPFRIGVILPGDQFTASLDGLKQGLKALGHGEGRDVVYIVQNNGGTKAQIIEATHALIAERVNLIYTATNTALASVGPLAKSAKIPVVFGTAAGPVESGLVPAYATPESHITGVTSGSIELTEKRMEVLREIFPRVKKIAISVDLEADSSRAAAEVARKAAPRLGLTLVERGIRTRQEGIDAANKLTSKDADVLFLLPGLSNTDAVGELAAIARDKRMPFAAYQVEHVRDGGALLSYGSSYFLQGKQSARLVSRILKGTPVYQLPIERPEKYELVLNLDTAQAIGVKFLPAVLSRADMIFRKSVKG